MHWLEVDTEGGELRMHYVDEGYRNTITHGGHFPQEDQGPKLAEVVIDFIRCTQ